ncbi:unnamed protein product [Prorocentrum cordatum]|uniref:Uncharacterized protein n=1 Tax=Prorocentrum cordatum TaxID=2364126 RepID=A0ABN9X844_9DINO|nr:unnamed protein product [Polarella glacialis]
MDEPQAEPAPADLDVTALLKKAKESRGADPWRDREHARFLRGGTAAATGDGGPVPSWVVEQQGAGRSRPVGGRHTTGLLRPAAGAGAGADPADATLRRVASAGRLRQARVVAAPAGGTGAGVEAFGGAPAARRVLPAVSRPGTR